MIGQTLGHYRILGKLGSGGMGEVYEAEDTRLGRRIALKVLPAAVSSNASRRERFEREAKAVAALNHPGIVTIHSVEQAGGTHFFTMELVDGAPLGDRLERGGLRLHQVLKIALPLVEAVAAAHRQGITHRDLKPDNILVTGDGRVKVLDFGLAKVHEPSDAPSGTRLPTGSLTQEGQIVGTVAYMSPEQAEGKPVDARSDVFSLGIILYEMCTGLRPFRGDTPISILSSILKDTPPPIIDLNRDLPRELSRIVNRCLSKDPARRFQSAQGLLSELTTLKEESDSGELQAASRDGATAWSAAGQGAAPGDGAGRARRFAYAGGAAVVVALAVIGYLAFGPARERSGAPSPGTGAPAVGSPPAVGEPRAGALSDRAVQDARRRIVVLPFENLGAAEDAYFAAGVTEEITSRLAAVGDLGVISRSSALQYAKAGKNLRQIGQELGVDYVLEGTVRWDRRAGGASRVRVTPQLIRVADDTHLWSDRYDRVMEDLFDVQSEIATNVVEQLGVAVLRPEERQALVARPTENLEAYQAYLRGLDHEINRDDREEANLALRMFERAVELDPDFALAWAHLSKTRSGMRHYRYDLSEERLAKAREAADRALRLQPDLPEAHLALGYYYYWGRKDYERALEVLTKAAGMRQNDPDVLEAVAYIRRRQGKMDEALDLLESAHRLNPRSVTLTSELAQTYAMMRRYEDAERVIDSALGMAPDNPYLYMGKSSLLLSWTGDLAAARAVLRQIPQQGDPAPAMMGAWFDVMEGEYERALATLERAPIEVIDTQDQYMPIGLLEGLIHYLAGRPERSRAKCQEALALLEEAKGERPQDPRVRAALGNALACLGRRDEAVREATLATDLYPVSKDAIGGPDFLRNLATVRLMVGETDPALDLLERLMEMPGGPHAGQLENDPLWRRLAAHPRFKELIARDRPR